jgi:hypothetical protein
LASAGSIRDFSVPGLRAAACTARAGEVESEVIRLFDRLRTPLLRYTWSLGLSVHNSEGIIEELFLAPVQHLQPRETQEKYPGLVVSRCPQSVLEAPPRKSAVTTEQRRQALEKTL